MFRQTSSEYLVFGSFIFTASSSSAGYMHTYTYTCTVHMYIYVYIQSVCLINICILECCKGRPGCGGGAAARS